MRNVELEVRGGKLVVTVDLSKPGEPSKSGKTMVIGTTKGNQVVDDQKGGSVVVGLNVYRKR